MPHKASTSLTGNDIKQLFKRQYLVVESVQMWMPWNKKFKGMISKLLVLLNCSFHKL